MSVEPEPEPEPDQDVDAHVRRLWRHRGTTVPTPRRGPRQQLDLDEILQTGIAIADAEGLAAVSTRAIAARFGKSGMVIYPYVGSKENLLALMQDHACAMPQWDDPDTSLADALQAWALALFEVYLAHPWLTERPWSHASQGPNEQDWLERLLRILDHWKVPPSARPVAVTMLYATVRATAETAASYQRMDRQGIAQWRDRAHATVRHIPDLPERYPLSTGLEPLTPQWQDNPRAALTGSMRLLAAGLRGAG
ncbi:TetR/AcrR family transcriptional regulator [Allorhizocola rhizosphaerae]|uniref:TetR/AcrR family transcriptional regulator n=1 Tax=Allorhizocola rhizosphaerae TaxID=1872709 RepID=UPI000E3E8D16|nr:TetR/AcrR family transcriptional regulator [Allorhizocola rhizosphaerae]